MRKQRGYFLILAVVFIFVMGLMGSLVAYLLASRAMVSAAVYSGLQTFYIAESGLEAAARYVTRSSVNIAPIRIACGAVTGTAQLTAATMSRGEFTVTATAPTVAYSSLSSAITSSATTLPVASAASFPAQGRVVVDRESIDYAAISGNSLIGVTRGVDGTLASSHASGASVGEFQCSLAVTAAIPSIASSKYQRVLQWGVQLQDGYAVGDRAGSSYSIYRWNGGTELAWSDESFASCGNNCRANLNAVSMLSYADGWAVGDRTLGGFLTFLRWNGSTWTPNLTVSGCNGQHLTGVSMVSSTQGWAVGERYTATCVGANRRYDILQWNGTTWVQLSPSTSPGVPADHPSNQNLNAVHVIDTTGNGAGNIGFAVGNGGRILQYNGTNWVAATSPTANNLFGVYVVSTSEAWAVGASGDILRWDGSTWSLFDSAVSQQLNAIAMIDTNGDGLADFGVAVGDSGRIMTYNGTAWTATTSSGNNLFAVGVIDENDVWAGGASGRLTHWDGSVWTTSAVTSVVNGLAFVAPKIKKATGWKQDFH
jgi:Tfp pilus assembly protein PilX